MHLNAKSEQNQTILIIDDDQAIVMLLKTTLSRVKAFFRPRRTDEALYQAKNAGCNRTVVAGQSGPDSKK